jgi:hypothetical protein
MSTHYDEKGKFFTDIISKKVVPVKLQTSSHYIEGNVHIRHGERLKDELNHSEPFLAVTDCVIFKESGTELYRLDFIAVNRANIIWISPVNGDDMDAGELS